MKKPDRLTDAQWALRLQGMTPMEAAGVILHECDYLRKPRRTEHLAGALRAVCGKDTDWSLRPEPTPSENTDAR